MTKEKFDGLAEDYERYRPRYPTELLHAVAAKVSPIPNPLVIDTGAGTGIELEGLLPLLPADARVEAVDISEDMVARGRSKLPQVTWHTGAAEPFLEAAKDIALVVAAQSYQWMDRPRYLRAVQQCLVSGGWIAIVQNNRDFGSSPFLDEYESLLEELSPGYVRTYRAFDIAAELREYFDCAELVTKRWRYAMRPGDFIGMSRSSTQVQRALAAHGDAFATRLRSLVERYASGGRIDVPYVTEAYLATAVDVGTRRPVSRGAKGSPHDLTYVVRPPVSVGSPRSPAEVLRELLMQRERPVRMIGVMDGLSAILATEVGFDALWASGLCISASRGIPDDSTMTMTELLDSTETIVRSTTLPVIADCDAGFGDVNAVTRLVRLFEARGVAGICIEDKQFPKRNSFRHGHKLADRHEFAAKIHAARAARRDKAFVVIARLEAFIAGAGLDEAITRAALFEDAGADALLVHSKATTPREVLDFAHEWNARGGWAPLVVVPTTYHPVRADELFKAGIQVVIYANQPLRAAVGAMRAAMAAILVDGSSERIEPNLTSLSELFRLTGTFDNEQRKEFYERWVAEQASALGRVRAAMP